jgi:penicillin amidase
MEVTMPTSRRITLALVTILALTGLSCAASRFIGYAIKPDAPDLNKQISHNELTQPVQITFDSHQVPHIVAQNDRDLWFATGYVQASERLFQMDMLRRMASGRISELLGAQEAPPGMPFKDTLGMDRFFRVMGLSQDAQRAADRLDAEGRAMGDAYVAGINAWIRTAENLPIEYRLLSETPEKWTVHDVLTVGRLTSFQLSVNMAHELLRYLLIADLGQEAQQEIFPGVAPIGPNIIEREDKDFRAMPRVNVDIKKDAAQALIQESGIDVAAWAPAAKAFLNLLGQVQQDARPYLTPAASNSWAVAGSRTASGKPILSNDPHLLHGAPSTFYLMHLSAPGIDAIGAVLPGTPFLSLGRNQHIGWSATNTFADVQDLYLEKLDPNDPTKYMTPEGPVPFKIEKHVIRERIDQGKYRNHPFDLRYTRHGAILNDSLIEGLPADAQPIALKTAAVWPSDEALTMMRFLRAGSVKEFFAALDTWGMPIQNWIAVDDAGHMGYYPAGNVPLRTTFNGTTPVPGWTDDFEWKGRIPVEELPKMYDPPSGMIVTANNQVVPVDDYPYPYSIDTMQGYRAGRIREMLTAKPDLTADDMRGFQIDAYSKQGDRLMPFLLTALDGIQVNDREKLALDALRNWDRVAAVDSVGASIFYATYREAWQLALDDDLPELFKKLVNVFGFTYHFFDRLWVEAPTAKVWDRKGTAQVENRDEILRQAWRTAVKNLSKKLGGNVEKWTWGKLHTITFSHPFGKTAMGKFDKGPYPIPGAWDTVWAAGGGFWPAEYAFPVSEGPAFRHVMDFNKLEDTRMVLDLGQSGWPMTPAYSNASEDWLNGRLWPLSMDPALYNKGASGILNLVPAQ